MSCGACPAVAFGSCFSMTRAARRSSSISTRTNRRPKATSRPEGFRWLFRCSGAKRGEPLLRVKHARLLPRGLFETEIELGGVVGRFDAEAGRFAASGLVPHEIADQRILDREHRVAAEILVAAVENVRRDRLIAVG